MCGPSPCEKPNCTWGERHREACEARSLLTMPHERRAAYYEQIAKKRGTAALQSLKAAVMAEVARKNERNAPW